MQKDLFYFYSVQFFLSSFFWWPSFFLFFAASDAATVAAAGADDAGAAEAALQYAGIRNRDSWSADRCATIYQCATLTPKARVIKYIPEVQADIIYILYTSLLLF